MTIGSEHVVDDRWEPRALAVRKGSVGQGSQEEERSGFMFWLVGSGIEFCSFLCNVPDLPPAPSAAQVRPPRVSWDWLRPR